MFATASRPRAWLKPGENYAREFPLRAAPECTRHRVALHEAGHFVAGVLFGLNTDGATANRVVYTNGDVSLGEAYVPLDVDRPVETAVMCLCGLPASLKFSGPGPGGGTDNTQDVKEARALLHYHFLDERMVDLVWLPRARAAASAFVSGAMHWSAIVAVANELLLANGPVDDAVLRSAITAAPCPIPRYGMRCDINKATPVFSTVPTYQV